MAQEVFARAENKYILTVETCTPASFNQKVLHTNTHTDSFPQTNTQIHPHKQHKVVWVTWTKLDFNNLNHVHPHLCPAAWRWCRLAEPNPSSSPARAQVPACLNLGLCKHPGPTIHARAAVQLHPNFQATQRKLKWYKWQSHRGWGQWRSYPSWIRQQTSSAVWCLWICCSWSVACSDGTFRWEQIMVGHKVLFHLVGMVAHGGNTNAEICCVFGTCCTGTIFSILEDQQAIIYWLCNSGWMCR